MNAASPARRISAFAHSQHQGFPVSSSTPTMREPLSFVSPELVNEGVCVMPSYGGIAPLGNGRSQTLYIFASQEKDR